jgi:Ca2+-transporting ATPase
MLENFLDQGLSLREVKIRSRQFGSNKLNETVTHPWHHLFLAQFRSPLMYILLFSALVSLILKETIDALVIASAALLNVALGFVQEFKAEKSLQALANVLSHTCIVKRGGSRAEIDAASLVPGDLVFVEAGDTIPADGVLLNAQDLFVNEAILTGESVPVAKHELLFKKNSATFASLEQQAQSAFMIPAKRKAEKFSDVSMYSGTTIDRGSAAFMVTAIGFQTQVGKVAKTLAKLEREQTPLQKRVNRLSNQLAVVVMVLVFGVFGAGLLAGQEMKHMFSLAVALGVSAIPEGLVISLTALLAVAMQRLLTAKALVRKMMAAEVLGSVDVICTDKTGTLTQGIFTIKEIVSEDPRLSLSLALHAMDITDPMEVALYEYAAQKAMSDPIKKQKRLDRKPFDSKTKVSLTLTDKELFVYGAPEAVIETSQASRAQKQTWLNQVEAYATKGFRITAMAHRKNSGAHTINSKMTQGNWYFLGLVVYEDGLRESVPEALQLAKQAGITLKIITGDHLSTTQALLHQAGVRIPADAIIDGATLATLPVETLASQIDHLQLFYRTSPDQKLSIVSALKQKGYTVAMTGDGVNDALALKRSDIGIVMENASSVSKETADMVLLDNNFATIVAAVEEGRSVIDNLRKILLYLLSDSFTEILIVLGALALGLVIPITPLQILWVNLVNDGPPNVALTLEPKAKDLLARKPTPVHSSLITKPMRSLIAIISLVTASVILLSYWWLLKTGYDVVHAQSVAFTMLGLDSLLYVFSCRSMESIWKSKPFENWWLVAAVILGLGFQLLAIYHPLLQPILGTVGLNAFDWGIVTVSSLLVVVCIEAVKLVALKQKTHDIN